MSSGTDAGPDSGVALDEDFHVHSTFSDGASTLAENVQAAGERGLRTLCRRSCAAGHIDMLLTDVVMPEMLGNEVADRIGAIRPGVPALFMSGYAQPILDSHGVLAPRYDILEKPWTEAALLTRVRKALSRAAPQ